MVVSRFVGRSKWHNGATGTEQKANTTLANILGCVPAIGIAFTRCPPLDMFMRITSVSTCFPIF